MRQREGERLKEYLNRFNALTIRFQTHDEEMMIAAFEHGMAAGPFNDSLIRNPTKTFSKVREQAVTHIEAEEASGSRKDAWCEFHRAFGHNVERCIALCHQLADLVKDWFLKKYLEDSQEGPQGEVVLKEPEHETSIHGELNTIY